MDNYNPDNIPPQYIPPHYQPYNRQPYQQPEKPPSYLAWNILATLFGCLPFGIVGIVYSARVDSLWQAGMYDEAWRASDNARKWALASASPFICAIVLSMLISILFLF